jgi:hypothetical protein
MPTQDAHLQFEAWANQYGPVYSLILGTKTMIVLNTHEAVKGMSHLQIHFQSVSWYHTSSNMAHWIFAELLDKRSAIYRYLLLPL